MPPNLLRILLLPIALKRENRLKLILLQRPRPPVAALALMETSRIPLATLPLESRPMTLPVWLTITLGIFVS